MRACNLLRYYRLVRCLQTFGALIGVGISQPEVVRLFKGSFREYSVERLMGFLTAFDQDVEIIARPRGKDGARGRISFRRAAA